MAHLARRERRVEVAGIFLWAGGTKSCGKGRRKWGGGSAEGGKKRGAGDAAQQGELRVCEKGQCMSWQIPDKAQGPAMQLPTVGWLVFFSDRNGVSRALPWLELPRLASYCLWSRSIYHP